MKLFPTNHLDFLFQDAKNKKYIEYIIPQWNYFLHHRVQNYNILHNMETYVDPGPMLSNRSTALLLNISKRVENINTCHSYCDY